MSYKNPPQSSQFQKGQSGKNSKDHHRQSEKKFTHLEPPPTPPMRVSQPGCA